MSTLLFAPLQEEAHGTSSSTSLTKSLLDGFVGTVDGGLKSQLKSQESLTIMSRASSPLTA